MLLSMIENPTRRRILEALVREPLYPLQLSKELGMSQQAIMKNLNALEKNGMVTSYQESSSIGPMRTVYEPCSEFTLVIDMRNGMFTARVIEPSGESFEESEFADREGLEEIKNSISELDNKIEEVDKIRLQLVREREKLISSAMSAISENDRAHKYLLYELLNKPNSTAKSISRETNVNENIVIEMMEEIDRAIKRV